MRSSGDSIALTDADAISPQLLPDIEILRYRSSHVLAIRVYPGSNRPHYLGS